tara:strand:+ start:4168 stop:4917 length:750 start_codon:yes stop_codon:yes gene_type:complete
MTKKWTRYAWALVLALMVTACSSSQTTEDEEALPDEVAAEEEFADTDFVPEEGTEEFEFQGDEESVAEEAPVLEEQPTEEFVAEETVEEQMTPAPVAEETFAQTGSYENYTIQRGDTLMKIAFEVYGDLYEWKKLYENNRDSINDPNILRVGQVIRIERPAVAPQISRNGEAYKIKPGDTLGTISKDVYGSKNRWKDLYENNRELIRDPNQIYAGFYLYYQPDEQLSNELATGGEPELIDSREPSSVKK